MGFPKNNFVKSTDLNDSVPKHAQLEKFHIQIDVTAMVAVSFNLNIAKVKSCAQGTKKNEKYKCLLYITTESHHY